MRITLLANPDNLHVRRWMEFLAGRGHELTIVTDPFTKSRPAEYRVLTPRWTLLTNILAFRLTPKPYGNARWKHLHYRGLVRASRPEIVHGFEALDNGLATALCGPYPKVLTPWGKDVHHDADQSPYAERMIRRGLAGVDIISTNDETMPEFLEKRFGLSRDKVMAFSWGADLEVFRPDLHEAAQAWRARLQIPPQARVILSPRNFLPYWGSQEIVEAIPEVLRQQPDAFFVILKGAGGDQQTFDAARRSLEAQGLGGAVRLIERPLASPDLAALFNLAEAFISIPRTDLLAQTILEGMACGCLPILGDRPAYRKHARPGQNALVLPEHSAAALATALLEALRNPALRQVARTENPHKMAREENWRHNALKMEAVYAEAIARFHQRRVRRP